MQTVEAVLLHISSTTHQFALQGLPEISQTHVPCFQRILYSKNSYEMCENTGDIYYSFCNSSDMYASDFKN